MIVGGVQHVGNNTAYPNLIEVFDPDTGQFSIMDHLDYGLTEPQLALLSTGSIFVAGQVQASMEAPVTKAGVGANKLKAADVGQQPSSLAVGSAVNGEIGHLYCVNVAVWTCTDPYFNNGTGTWDISVGHVFVGKPDLDHAQILSQFPVPRGLTGANVTFDWVTTITIEKRLPVAMFQIHLTNPQGFWNAVVANTGPKLPDLELGSNKSFRNELHSICLRCSYGWWS